MLRKIPPILKFYKKYPDFTKQKPNQNTKPQNPKFQKIKSKIFRPTKITKANILKKKT